MYRIWATLALASLSWQGMAADSPQWRAQGVESQYHQQLDKTEKSSLPGLSSTTTGQTIQQSPARSLAARTEAADPDFWIYDAAVTLSRDQDYDGYYHHLSVKLDADTIYDRATVYARFYLGHNGHYYEYHTSSSFDVKGETADDTFTVDSNLLEGFPADDYDLYIELYDAYNDQLVATLSSDDDEDLYRLPLESRDYDQPPSGTVVSVEYAGSSGMVGLMGLLLFVGWRRLVNPRRRNI